jgi:hypothetical protein
MNQLNQLLFICQQPLAQHLQQAGLKIAIIPESSEAQTGSLSLQHHPANAKQIL